MQGNYWVHFCHDFYFCSNRQPVPEEEPLEDEDQQNQLEEDDNFNTENYCDFTVYIKNAGDKGGLVVDATSMDTEINYNNVFMTDDIEEEK